MWEKILEFVLGLFNRDRGSVMDLASTAIKTTNELLDEHAKLQKEHVELLREQRKLYADFNRDVATLQQKLYDEKVECERKLRALATRIANLEKLIPAVVDQTVEKVVEKAVEKVVEKVVKVIPNKTK